jgi:hypothetical protein
MSNLNYILDKKTLWKDKELIKEKLPISFENFPTDLQDLFIWNIQCDINLRELHKRIYELKKELMTLEAEYINSSKEAREAGERIKSYFYGNFEVNKE